ADWREGFTRHQKNSNNFWIAAVQGRDSERRLPAGGTGKEGGRDGYRKNQRAGVRPGVANVQPGVWCDAESVRPHEDMRRKHGRRSCGISLWHGAAGRWERLWRIAAESPEFLWRGRTAALAGTSAEYAGGSGVSTVFGVRRRGA